MIIEIQRGSVRLQIGDKTVTVEGERFLRGFGSPDMVIYENSIQRWDPPFDGLEIDQKTKKQILAELATEISKKGMTIEIE